MHVVFKFLNQGATPTIVRACAINMGMLGPYDQAKEVLSRYFGQTKKTNLM